MNINSKIERIIRKYCQHHEEIAAAYIFGSRARNNYNPNSDLDLALLLKEDIDKFTAFDFRMKAMYDLEKKLNLEVDVVIFSQANLRLQHEIIGGKLVFGLNNTYRIAEEKKTIIRYLDMKPMYKEYEKNIGKGL